jgi:hypothetical protein
LTVGHHLSFFNQFCNIFQIVFLYHP